MSFLKGLFGKNKTIDPIDDQLKEKIERLVVAQLDNYGSNYRNELKNVMNEWNEIEKQYTFEDADKEANNRAGLDSFKDTVSNKVWNETEDDVENNVKSKTSNELVIKASKAAGKKTIELMVSKSIDSGIQKIRNENKDNKA